MEQQSVSDISQAKLGNHEDAEYDSFLARMQFRFENLTAGQPVFTTDAEQLWEAYLSAFEPDQRQFHNCNACRHFIERFGSLVTINAAGDHTSIFWSDVATLPDSTVVHWSSAPSLYAASIAAIDRRVRRAQVTGVFLSDQPQWGQPLTGAWRHFAVAPPAAMHFKHATLSASQAMAEKVQDRGNIILALHRYSRATVDQAVALLKTEALARSEKVIGPAEWFAKLHAARAAVRSSEQRISLTWLAVALAPPGFCHPRSSMIGTLLEDLAQGLEFAEVARRFRAKMDPAQYQRPQAAPAAGNIAAAEKLVERLGVAPALERRYARLDEIQTIWIPAAPEPPAAGVFGHLKPKGATVTDEVHLPIEVITWTKFARTVLPEAQLLFARIPNPGAFAALVTAVNTDAPPMLQWDRLEQRNPVAWYMSRAPTPASRWNLTPGAWAPVTAVAEQPSQWFGAVSPHHGEGALLIIDGARDTAQGHGGLFPENLKSEFHSIRATIEAHSKAAKVAGAESASACGIKLKAGGMAVAHLRAHLPNGVVAEYRIDRWD